MSTIEFFIGAGIRGPIAAGSYHVGQIEVQVSYPSVVDFGMGPQVLPQGLSTLFVASWDDPTNKDANDLKSQTYHRHLVVHKAINAINEILLAFKLVRLGHIDSCGLRTIGIYDTLFYFSKIDGDFTGDLNVGLRSSFEQGIQGGAADPHDPFNTTLLAKKHIASDSYPVARRYTRCYELLEHGFYSEAFIIAFSIMDDLVQDMLHHHLEAKGMHTKGERNALLRGIKENRLKIYLGPLLKVLSGSALNELWPKAEKAMEWLNQTRNNIAHGGYGADYNAAAVGIYACVKILYTLHHANLIKSEFSVEFFRHSKLTASWTNNPADWVPVGPVAESMDYAS